MVKLKEKQFWAWREPNGSTFDHRIEWNDGEETHLLVVAVHGVVALTKLLKQNGYEDMSYWYHHNQQKKS